MDVNRPTGSSTTLHSCEQMLQKYVRRDGADAVAAVSATTSIIVSSSDPHLAHSTGGADVFVRSKAAMACPASFRSPCT